MFVVMATHKDQYELIDCPRMRNTRHTEKIELIAERTRDTPGLPMLHGLCLYIPKETALTNKQHTMSAPNQLQGKHVGTNSGVTFLISRKNLSKHTSEEDYKLNMPKRDRSIRGGLKCTTAHDQRILPRTSSPPQQ